MNCTGFGVRQDFVLEMHDFRKDLELNTIEGELYRYMCFNTKFYNIDVPIFGGRRTIVDVRL